MNFQNPINLKFFLPILFLATGTCAFSQDDYTNIIPNGNFEEGNKQFISDLSYDEFDVSPGKYSVVEDANSVNYVFRPIAESSASGGNYLVADVSFEPDVNFWCTSVPVTPVSTYKISLSAADLSLDRNNPPVITLLIDGKAVGNEYKVNNTGWQHYSWEWNSGKNPDTVAVCLRNMTRVPHGNDLAIDDISMVMVKTDYIAPKQVIKRTCPYEGDTIRKLVHFGFNEAVLTDYSKSKLNKIFHIAQTCPDNRIKIIGHTDPFGDEEYNLSLSRNRSLSIKKYLIENGISEGRFVEEYLGESQILEEKLSIPANVINRRVEFVVLPEAME